jgi:hypothetical protein
MHIYTFLVFVIFSTGTLFSQTGSHEFLLNPEEIKKSLSTGENTERTDDNLPTITLPNHLGYPIKYIAKESSVMSPEMEKMFPEFKTYALQGVDQKLAHGRIFVSPFGVEGLLFVGNHQVKIEAKDKSNPLVHKAYIPDLNTPFTCGTHEEAKIIKGQFSGLRNPNGGTERQYEMAIVCTGEFYQNAAFGNNNLTQANAAVVNIINMINVYWNAEMSIRITIFQTPFIYTNPATDPFDPAAGNLTGQASSAIHTNFPAGGYDLGHGLHYIAGGGSGVAGVGVVCNNTVSGGGRINARGWSSGLNQTTVAINIMTHEVGHMFNSPHTFNGLQGFCQSEFQHPINTAYEIASGTTIMSYAGLCGSDNIQSTQDLYFHSKSLELFFNYVNSTGCSTNTSTGNTPPTVDATICAGPYIIPISTPFELTGSGSDANNNPLTYVWEQIDEDGNNTRPTQGFLGSTAAASAIAPLFRSYPPSSSGFRRSFPSTSLVLANNYTNNFEPLPTVSRTLNFRLTVRDNQVPNGAYAYDNIAVTVDGTKGPLSVTAPNTAVTINAGSSSTITWAVNSTNSICNSVNILLSLDGGQTYPVTLAAATANDGTQSVTFPGGLSASTTARVRIESACVTCVRFYDVSNVNFTISSACNTVSSNICNTAPVTAQEGSNALILTMDVSYGNVFTTKSMVPSGAAVISALHSGTAPFTGGCTSINFGDRAAVARFKPSASGNYTFNMTGGFRHLTIYQGEYNPSSPCTNFLGSTCYNGGMIFNPMTLNLNACNIYTAVFFDAAGTNGTLTVTPPAGAFVYDHNPPTSPNYSYTYAAVNTTNNLIAAVSSTSNFTSLSPGSYCVYGLYYYSGASSPPTFFDPSTFVGQTISGLLNAGVCNRASENCRPLTVTQICGTVVTNGLDDGPGSLRRAVTCNSEGSTITFASGVSQVNLASVLSVTKNMNLQGISNISRPEIVTTSAGINISAGKTLTLQNVDLKHTGSQTVTGGGTLNITGTTVTKQ